MLPVNRNASGNDCILAASGSRWHAPAYRRGGCASTHPWQGGGYGPARLRRVELAPLVDEDLDGVRRTMLRSSSVYSGEPDAGARPPRPAFLAPRRSAAARSGAPPDTGPRPPSGGRSRSPGGAPYRVLRHAARLLEAGQRRISRRKRCAAASGIRRDRGAPRGRRTVGRQMSHQRGRSSSASPRSWRRGRRTGLGIASS